MNLDFLNPDRAPMDNDTRAQRAMEAAGGYASKIGEADPECDFQDLICDLCHAAERADIDPLEMVRKALCHFLAEKHDDPDGMRYEFAVEITYQQTKDHGPAEEA